MYKGKNWKCTWLFLIFKTGTGCSREHNIKEARGSDKMFVITKDVITIKFKSISHFIFSDVNIIPKTLHAICGYLLVKP